MLTNMKKVMARGIMTILAFVMVTAASITTTKAQGSVSLQVFYDELQPYGTWMDYGHHGYVWVPRVDRDFVPYGTNGYWINTAYGNTWVSDYAWGWAPFHYGRWLYDDFYGWMWVPDTVWGPAWVAWRSGGGYYGWAPLMPGMGIHASFGFYNNFPAHYWNFVPYRYVTYRQVHRHCVPRPQVVKIIHHTTIITHNYTDNRRRTYFTGPSRDDIERRGGGRVTVHQINETSRPSRTEVSRSTANFYRPDVDDTRESRSRAVPNAYLRKNSSGNYEQVESRVQRTRETPANTLPQQRNDNWRTSEEFKSIREERSNGERERYQPSQRTGAFEYQGKPSYEKMPEQHKYNARDRYNAPHLERAPNNRDGQRKSYATPQPRQRTESSMQRQDGGSYNRSSGRSSMSPSRQPTMQRSEPNGASRQPSRSGSGHFRMSKEQ